MEEQIAALLAHAKDLLQLDWSKFSNEQQNRLYLLWEMERYFTGKINAEDLLSSIKVAKEQHP